MMRFGSARGLTGLSYFCWSGVHRHLQPRLFPAYEQSYGKTSLSGLHNGSTSLNVQNFGRTSLNVLNNVRTSLNPLNIGRTSFMSHISSFTGAAPDSTLLANIETVTLKGKLSECRAHCTISGETMDNVPNNNLPITLVTRILQTDGGENPQKSESKTPTRSAKVESTYKSGSFPTLSLKVRRSEPAISSRMPKVDSKAVVPYFSSNGMKNVWRGSPPRRPNVGDDQPTDNSAFKETYERLRKLGLLKLRTSNSHLSMTSPSGKAKFAAENAKAAVDKTPKVVKPPPKKPTVIKSKFLHNNVVVKVQHFYSSQGKEVPEEIKKLTCGKANRYPASSNSFTELKRRRYQVYPCTSPSSSHFSRTMKKRE